MNAHDYGNQPAYPFTPSAEAHASGTETVIQATAQHPGMTIRDRLIESAIAGAALPILMAKNPNMTLGGCAAYLADEALAEMCGGVR